MDVDTPDYGTMDVDTPSVSSGRSARGGVSSAKTEDSYNSYLNKDTTSYNPYNILQKYQINDEMSYLEWVERYYPLRYYKNRAAYENAIYYYNLITEAYKIVYGDKNLIHKIDVNRVVNAYLSHKSPNDFLKKIGIINKKTYLLWVYNFRPSDFNNLNDAYKVIMGVMKYYRLKHSGVSNTKARFKSPGLLSKLKDKSISPNYILRKYNIIDIDGRIYHNRYRNFMNKAIETNTEESMYYSQLVSKALKLYEYMQQKRSAKKQQSPAKKQQPVLVKQPVIRAVQTRQQVDSDSRRRRDSLPRVNPETVTKGEQSQILSFFFNDRKETLHIYYTGGEILRNLIRHDNPLCPMINSKIKFDKRLGGGAYGTAYEISFPGMGLKKYAVKEVNRTYKDEESGKESFVPSLQDLKNNKMVLCRLSKTISYKAFNGSVVNIPVGSYICKHEVYPEYLISLLVGQLSIQKQYRIMESNSINFLQMYDFATCYKPDLSQYTFMEKVDTTFHHLLVNRIATPEDVESIFLQVLCAIYTYQYLFKISHNDLKPDNVFLEKINMKTEYNGHKLYQYTHMEYKLDGLSIFIPIKYNGYIVKIGDWGLSTKFYKRMIGKAGHLYNSVFDTSFATKDDDYGFQYNVPNWYAKQYDLAYFMYNMYMLGGYISNVIEPFLLYTFNTKKLSTVKSAVNTKTYRPFNNYIDRCNGVDNLLKSHLMNEYKKIPRNCGTNIKDGRALSCTSFVACELVKSDLNNII